MFYYCHMIVSNIVKMMENEDKLQTPRVLLFSGAPGADFVARNSVYLSVLYWPGPGFSGMCSTNRRDLFARVLPPLKF